MNELPTTLTMEGTFAIAVIIGALASVLIAIAKDPCWPRPKKERAALLISVGMGLVLAIVARLVNPPEWADWPWWETAVQWVTWITLVVAVVTVSTQTVYRLLKTQLNALSAATAPVPPSPEGEVEPPQTPAT